MVIFVMCAILTIGGINHGNFCNVCQFESSNFNVPLLKEYFLIVLDLCLLYLGLSYFVITLHNLFDDSCYKINFLFNSFSEC